MRSGDSLQLCEVCRSITFDKISDGNTYPLHEDLNALVACWSTCLLCRETLTQLESHSKTYALPVDDTEYRCSRQVRLSLREGGPGTLSIRLLSVHGIARADQASAPPRFGGEDLDLISTLWRVHTNDGDPSAGTVPVLGAVGKSTASPESLEFARSCLVRCIRGECNKPSDDTIHGIDPPNERSAGADELPSRLVEIDDEACSLRLVQLPSNQAAYVSLSYVWGKSPAPWKTTSHNVRRREGGFTVRRLPQTLRDAVRITHSLGHRLLWVDCLCIVQDNAHDWKRESAKMATIYANAVVTIMAEASSNSTCGIFNSRSVSFMQATPHAKLTHLLADGRQSTLFLARFDGSRSDMSGPSLLSTRAWCAQERTASSRTLHFGEHQLAWECRHRCDYEDQINIWMPPPRLRRSLFGEPDGLFGDHEEYGKLARVGHAWYEEFISQDYSPRRLTFPKDRLDAVAGIAAMFRPFGLGRYLAGHWEQNLLASLLWRASPEEGLAKRSPVYRAPSWSWASLDGRVSWNGHSNYMLETRAELLEAQTAVDPASPLGGVLGGHIRLRAPALDARLEVDESGESYLVFDNGTTERQLTLDDENVRDGPVVVCYIGMAHWRWDHSMLYASSLLLRQSGSTYTRIGVLDTIHVSAGHVGELAHYQHSHEQLELKRTASVLELVIV